MADRVTDPFSFRVKVFDGEVDGRRRQCVAIGFMNLDIKTGRGTAMLLADNHTFAMAMHVEDWNAMPFCEFATNGERAERPPKTWLPVDPPPPPTKS